MKIFSVPLIIISVLFFPAEALAFNVNNTAVSHIAFFNDLTIWKVVTCMAVGAGIVVAKKYFSKPKSLYEAARLGDLNALKHFCEIGKNIDERDSEGSTPLHIAILEGYFNIVQYLVKKGAKIDEKNRWGDTPLAYAIELGRLDIIKFLIAYGADIHIKLEGDATYLHLAAEHGHLKIVRYLVEKGLFAEEKSRCGQTALHLSAWRGKYDVVRYFVEEKRVEIDKEDVLGHTALDLAALRGDFEMVKYLVERGANCSKKDKDGDATYQLAPKNNAELVKYLTFAASGSDIFDTFAEEYKKEALENLKKVKYAQFLDFLHLMTTKTAKKFYIWCQSNMVKIPWSNLAGMYLFLGNKLPVGPVQDKWYILAAKEAERYSGSWASEIEIALEKAKWGAGRHWNENICLNKKNKQNFDVIIRFQ